MNSIFSSFDKMISVLPWNDEILAKFNTIVPLSSKREYWFWYVKRFPNLLEQTEYNLLY